MLLLALSTQIVLILVLLATKYKKNLPLTIIIPINKVLLICHILNHFRPLLTVNPIKIKNE